jgi:hypothetical protein
MRTADDVAAVNPCSQRSLSSASVVGAGGPAGRGTGEGVVTRGV